MNPSEATFVEELRSELEEVLRTAPESNRSWSRAMQELVDRSTPAVAVVTESAIVVNAAAKALWSRASIAPRSRASRAQDAQSSQGAPEAREERMAPSTAMLEIGGQMARLSSWAFDRVRDRTDTGGTVPVAEVGHGSEPGSGERLVVVRPDGSRHLARAYARAVRARDGHVVAVLCVFFAIPEKVDTSVRARAAHQRASFLARASTRLLSTSLDPDTILRQLAALVVPAVAEACVVDVIDDEDEERLRRVVTESVSPDKAVLIDRVNAMHERRGERPPAIVRVVRSGVPEIHRKIDVAALEWIANDPEQRALLLDLAPRSAMVVPLLTRHRVVGAITLIRFSEEHVFEAADLDMAEQLGLNAGLAVENARLYQYEQQARTTIERTANRMRRLQAMMSDLAIALSSDDVSRAVIQHGQLAVGAAAGLLWKVDEARQELQLVHSSMLPEEAKEKACASYGVLPLQRRGPFSWTLSSREPVFVTSLEELHERFPESSIEVDAVASMPLFQQGKVRGVLAFTFDRPRSFDVDERSFLALVAAHGAQGLYRASVYEDEQKARAEMGLLYALVNSANRSTSTTELYEASLDVVGRGLRAERLAILLDDEHGVPRFVAARGISEPYRKVVEGHVTWPGHPENPPPVLVEDVEKYEDFRPFWAALRKENIRSIGFFPLVHNGELFGKLVIYSDVLRVFSEDEKRLAQTIAGQLAQALVRKRTEADVEEARAAAEYANRMKDEFLAVVSHELRTPLSSIMGWASILQTERRNDPVMLAKGLAAIERNAKAQATIIGDILDVSRIIRGKLVLDAHPISIVPLVVDTIETLRTSAAAKQITVELDVGSDRFMLVGDPDRIRQVAWNLVSNAIKFTPSGGRVKVRLHREADAIVLTVKDTGRGISSDFVPYVFDRFRQADASTTRREGGLGLGLSIVRHLVELHGGQVAVASEGVGKGATFTAKFPVRALVTEETVENREAVLERSMRPAPSAVPVLGDTALEGVRVLVVDDQPDAREMISEALTSYGAIVTVAGSAQEAVDALPRCHPEVLVTDIGMPDEDGFALLRRIRALPGPDRMLPAIAVTAYARAEDARRVMGAGFQSHVAKPARLDILAHAVARAVGRQPQAAPMHDA